MKIVTILGARPQFVKAAVISDKVNDIENLIEVIVHTGQHFDQSMSDIFFNEMDIPQPKYNLNINQMSHGQMMAKMMEKIEPILMNEKPNGVLVYGDTNSTLAGSLTAAKLNIPVFHVESGLRSYNREMPEEINRVMTDHLSKLLFCPTENAVNILAKEGIQKGVKDCGDVMYDAFLKFNQQIKNSEDIILEVESPFILATIHRPENTDNKHKLISIFRELDKINEKTRVVLPLHPRTKGQLQKYGVLTKVQLIAPVGYLSMLSLLNSTEMVITDSGGLQKESFFAKKKCIIVRKETEWTELIDIGVNRLSNPEELYDTFEKMNVKKCDFSSKPYGDGNAGNLILDSIVKFISSGIC